VAEGAPLLREYVGKTCIEGSNPSDSAKYAFFMHSLNPQSHKLRGFFVMSYRLERGFKFKVSTRWLGTIKNSQ
jgi:hypothetical protein